MTKDKVLTLQEVADILHLRDTRTVLAWGRQGRFDLIGERKGILVNAASLDAYIEGRSAWHRAKEQSRNDPGASLVRVVFAIDQAAKSRSKHISPSQASNPDTKPFTPRYKIRYGHFGRIFLGFSQRLIHSGAQSRL